MKLINLAKTTTTHLILLKLELCHRCDVYPHMLHWHRIFCMLSHKTREANLWQFLRIIMPLSFMAILTFELLNSFAWHAIQWLWTKLMYRVILKSHNEWHSYGPDKLIYGHFLPLNWKCDLDLGDFAWHTVQWLWTNVLSNFKISQWTT